VLDPFDPPDRVQPAEAPDPVVDPADPADPATGATGAGSWKSSPSFSRKGAVNLTSTDIN